MTFDALRSAMFNLSDAAPDVADRLTDAIGDALSVTQHDTLTADRFRVLYESIRRFTRPARDTDPRQGRTPARDAIRIG